MFLAEFRAGLSRRAEFIALSWGQARGVAQQCLRCRRGLGGPSVASSESSFESCPRSSRGFDPGLCPTGFARLQPQQLRKKSSHRSLSVSAWKMCLGLRLCREHLPRGPQSKCREGNARRFSPASVVIVLAVHIHRERSSTGLPSSGGAHLVQGTAEHHRRRLPGCLLFRWSCKSHDRGLRQACLKKGPEVPVEATPASEALQVSRPCQRLSWPNCKSGCMSALELHNSQFTTCHASITSKEADSGGTGSVVWAGKV